MNDQAAILETKLEINRVKKNIEQIRSACIVMCALFISASVAISAYFLADAIRHGADRNAEAIQHLRDIIAGAEITTDRVIQQDGNGVNVINSSIGDINNVAENHDKENREAGPQASDNIN